MLGDRELRRAGQQMQICLWHKWRLSGAAWSLPRAPGLLSLGAAGPETSLCFPFTSFVLCCWVDFWVWILILALLFQVSPLCAHALSMPFSNSLQGNIILGREKVHLMQEK